jgi:hypothetical protein
MEEKRKQEELNNLYERKKKLLASIEFTKQKKNNIIQIPQTLVSKYNAREITRLEYYDQLSKALAGKSVEEWIKYYDDYLGYYEYQIQLCERLIKESHKESKIKRKINLSKILLSLIVIVFAGLLIFSIYSFGPVAINKTLDFTKSISDSEVRLAEGVVGDEEIVEDVEVGELISEKPDLDIKLEDKSVNVLDEEIIQYQAVIGKPVIWKKKFTTNSVTGFNVKLPEDSENVQIKKGNEDITKFANIGEEFFGKEINVKLKKSKITGQAVGNENLEKQDYEIIYETPAPQIKEELIGSNKKIIVSGPDDVHYENILSFTELSNELDKNELGRLKLYELKNGQRIETKFIAYDTNENGLIDSIEWITPRLSEAEFLLIIEISQAEHLDSDRVFIEGVYDLVKSKDDIWFSANNGDYLRVSFEELLDNGKDITLYARGQGSVEVYEFDSDNLLIEFEVDGEREYKEFLVELEDGKFQDVFDLKIIGNVEIDYVVDPIYVPGYNVGFVVLSVPLHEGLEQPILEFLESKGHNVTIIDDSNFNFDVGSLDVVVVSPNAYASNLDWLKDKEIGILFTSGKHYESFEFGTGGTTNTPAQEGTGSMPNISEPNHYITEEYASYDSVKVTNGIYDRGYISGWDDNPASEVKDLFYQDINSSRAWMLVADKDDVLAGGINVSAERRAFMGIAFFYNYNLNGTYFFERALKWVNYQENNLSLIIHDSSAQGVIGGKDFLINASAEHPTENVSIFADIDQSLLLWLRMDDNTSTHVIDQSSYENDCEILNSPEKVVGMMGDAFYFNTSNYLNCSTRENPYSYLDSEVITISTWVKILGNHSDPWTRIISTPSSFLNQYSLATTRGWMGLRFVIGRRNGLVNGSTEVNFGEWYHVVAGYKEGGVPFIYLNGEEVDPLWETDANIDNFPGDLMIGIENDLDREFNGSIDDLMVFNRTLSDNEIKMIYANQSEKHFDELFENQYPGDHNYTVYAQDNDGTLLEQEMNFTLDADIWAPDLWLEDTTTPEGIWGEDNIYINVGSSDVGLGDSNISTFIDWNENLLGWWRFEEEIASSDLFFVKMNYGSHSCGSGNDWCDWTDIDRDTIVGPSDVYLVKIHAGESGCAEPGWCSNADVTRDGFVGSFFEESSAYAWEAYSGDLEAVEGYFGQGVSTNSRIILEERAILETLNGLGISMMINPQGVPSAGDYQWIFSKGEEMTQPYSLSFNESMQVSFCLNDGSITCFNSTDNLTEDEWNHLVVSWNGSDVLVYLDGETIISEEYSSTLLDTNENIYIGGKKDISSSVFIDDVMLFRNSLTQEEIFGLYGNQTTKSVRKNYTNLGEGSYSFITHSQDTSGNLNSISRFIIYDSGEGPPYVIYEPGTPSSGVQENDNIYVNLSVSDIGRGDKNVSGFISFNDVLGWWRMDQYDSNGIRDRVGSNHLDFEGGLSGSDIINGKVGKALQFDGDDDYLQLPQPFTSDLEEITLSMWVNTSDWVAEMGLYEECYDGQFWAYSVQADNWIIRRSGGGGARPMTMPLGLPTDEWVHLAFVYSVDDSNTRKIYVNGILNDTQSDADSSIISNRYGVQTYAIGKACDNDGFNFNGSLDDVIMFNRSLESDEISALYGNQTEKYFDKDFTNLADGDYQFRGYGQDSFGNVGSSSLREITIGSFDNPEIVWVSNISDGGRSPHENTVQPYYAHQNGGVTPVTFSFIAQSEGGVGILYTSASGNSLTNAKFISPAGVGENLAGGCSFVSSGAQADIGGAQGVKYDCTVNMDFWSAPDNTDGWGIEVIVTDRADQTGTNITKTFNVEETIWGEPDANAFDWENIDITATNVYSQVPVVITNEGNGEFDVEVKGAEVRAANYGESGKAIPADRFRATNISTGCTGGNLLDDGVGPKSSGLNVVRGSDSTGDLYVCITSIIDLELTVQTYTSRVPWEISMFAVSLMVRKRKKKRLIKKKLKLTEEDILGLNKVLKDKYNIGLEELLESSNQEEVEETEIVIPIMIFNRGLSPAEALAKYLKENMNMRFSEIARLINRDERTIWINYRDANRKKKEKIKIEKEILVSIEIFADRRLSILESVVYHFKENGYRNVEIAEMLGKDQRNISTLYSRIKKKMDVNYDNLV